MEFSQILFTLFVLALCIVPVWWLIYAGNSRNRKLKETLKNATGQKKLKLFDVWSNKGIVLNDAGFLFYITLDGDERIFSSEKIDLTAVQDCQIIINGNQSFKGENPPIKEVYMLELQITTVTKKQDPIILKLFESKNDDAFEFNHFVQIGQKWKKIILERVAENAIISLGKPAKPEFPDKIAV